LKENETSKDGKEVYGKFYVGPHFRLEMRANNLHKKVYKYAPMSYYIDGENINYLWG